MPCLFITYSPENQKKTTNKQTNQQPFKLQSVTWYDELLSMFYKISSDSSSSALNMVTMQVSKTNSRDCRHKEGDKTRNLFYHMSAEIAAYIPLKYGMLKKD